VPGCVPVAVPGCCTASAQNPHSTPWRWVPVPRASDRIVSVRLGGSRCRDPATGRPSTRRVTAPECHGRAGRAERRFGSARRRTREAGRCAHTVHLWFDTGPFFAATTPTRRLPDDRATKGSWLDSCRGGAADTVFAGPEPKLANSGLPSRIPARAQTRRAYPVRTAETALS